MATELQPKIKKVDSKGAVHVAWMKPGAQRATRVNVEGSVRKSGTWWAKTSGGEKQDGFKTQKAAAEWIIAKLNGHGETPPPAKRKRGSTEYEFTAEDIERERDQKQQSWKQVATALGLKTPGGARKAYSVLTGRDHSTSVLNGRTTRSSGGEMVKGEAMKPIWSEFPKWSKANAEDWKRLRKEVEDFLRCPTCHGTGWKKGPGNERTRCHDGVVITRDLGACIARRQFVRGKRLKSAEYTPGKNLETIRVQKVHKWYRPTKECPVPAIGFTNAENGGGHVWRLDDFLN